MKLIQNQKANKKKVTRAGLVNNIEKNKDWDVVVIGGGASGLGAAIDAVSRGFSTLLLEQYDFTKGTSSRSTKLVHGGVRYLAQGNISLVLEALKERGLLLKNAPHLVTNTSFLIPAYNWWSIPFYTIGLTIYDLLAGRLSFGRSLPRSKATTLKNIPTLLKKGLRGSTLYHDGQFDDARLGINMAQTVNENGGTAINYFKVNDFIKTNGKISGVKATDTETQKSYIINAKVVINATGVFVNQMVKKDDPKAEDIIKPSQGVHLVLDKSFLPTHYGLMIPKTPDGRVLFAVPWHDKVIVGTTDMPKDACDIEPMATNEEVDFILETAGRYLERKPTRADVKSIFAGLRPLAAPKNVDGKTKEISRSHKVIESDSGLLTIIGGKWTTYRQMGEDIIDAANKLLNIPKVESTTEALLIHGFKKDVDFDDPFYFYGNDIQYINELLTLDPKLNDWLSESLQIKKVQAVFACRNEMARTVEDVLARRTRALFLDAAESIKMAPAVAEILATELGKDNAWKNDQIKIFTTLANRYLLK